VPAHIIFVDKAEVSFYYPIGQNGKKDF